jgi:phospholipase C
VTDPTSIGTGAGGLGYRRRKRFVRAPSARTPFAVVATILVVTSGLAVLYVELPSAQGALSWTAGLPRLQHVVILLEENHAYDNYFGTYCTTKGQFCPASANGIPPGICVPVRVTDPTGPCVQPYSFNAANLTSPTDLGHDYNNSHQSFNNGSMNGFVQAERSNETMGHYNGTTLPVYWDIAQKFGLADNFYSSTLSWSLPNHWYLVAGQSPAEAENHTFANSGGNGNQTKYLAEANATPSAEDLLAKDPNVTWKWYDNPLQNYSAAIHQTGSVSTGGAFDNWDPQAAKAESYTAPFVSHFVLRKSFFTDAAAGNLPNISWIMPPFNESDHPTANLTQGQNFIASLVNAVESSPEWGSTAFFVAWDDYGGFYDHVPPPQIDGLGLGFRVPLLVVSPWTPAGHIGEKQMSFESLLRLVEVRWNLGCFTKRDCTAVTPSGFFDWNLHRAPVFFEPYANATYPYHPPPAHTGQYINESLALNSYNETTDVFAPDID